MTKQLPPVIYCKWASTDTPGEITSDEDDFIFASKDEARNTVAYVSAESVAEKDAERERMRILLDKSISLMQRSKRIIAGQVPGIPHLIETDLENLTYNIEEELANSNRKLVTK